MSTDKIICPKCGKDWSGDEGKQNFANIDVIYCFTRYGGCGHKSPKSECLQPEPVNQSDLACTDVPSAEPKQGDMVWGWNGCDDNWHKKPDKFLVKDSDKGGDIYLCRNLNNNFLMQYRDISLTDPHSEEEPDTPDWLPEDCELWPRNVASGGYPVMYKSPGIGNRYTHAVLEDPRLIGFAIENGRGGVDIRNSPLWYTDGRGNYASRYGATCDQLATCLGVVMRKGE